MLLDVPFVADGDYPDFLADHADSLGTVHFSVTHPSMADARQRMGVGDLDAIIAGLAKLADTPRYVLMNSRLHHPEKYFSEVDLAATGDMLSLLIEKGGLTGLIFADPYYLQALSDAHPDIVSQLEAVPSINCQLDSSERVFAMLSIIDGAAFRAPSRLILDRALNRDMGKLKDVSEALRSKFNDLELYLMANEGCLYSCPFKPAHDAHVALVNEGICGERTFAMNRDYGCIRQFMDDPGRFLVSPFIRPEDVSGYEKIVDGIKLCGRNKGIGFLKRTISAYVSGKYHGNLLDLMDAMGDLADRVDLDNDGFPDDYFDRVTSCDKHCSSCGWCGGVAGAIVSTSDPGLPSLE